MKNTKQCISFGVADALPLNQTLVIPVSKIQDHEGIIEVSWRVLAIMNLVVAIDCDASCFYIVKNRWGMDNGSPKDLKNNPVPLRCLESFLLKPDVFTMEELYQNADNYENI